MSIAETLLAATIFSLVTLAVLDLLPCSALTARRAEHGLEAVSLAQSMLDTMRAAPFADLEAHKGRGWCGGDAQLARLCPSQAWPRPPAEDGVRLVARCRVDGVAGAACDNLLHLVVSVRWAERAAVRQPQELAAEFALAAAPGYRELVEELTIHAVGP